MGKTGFILIAAAGGATLAACATATNAETDPCGSEQYAYLMGEPEGQVRAAQLPTPHRIYSRGDMVTMDFVEDRLNVILEDGVVVELKCG